MTKQRKYVLYDDLRKVGEYTSLNEVFETGLIRSNKTYFYRAFARERLYIRDNICLFYRFDLGARCAFLGNQIARRARLYPDPGALNQTLTKVIKQITNIDL